MVGLKKRGVITAVAGILAAVTITGCSAAPDNDATVVTVGTEKVSYERQYFRVSGKYVSCKTACF